MSDTDSSRSLPSGPRKVHKLPRYPPQIYSNFTNNFEKKFLCDVNPNAMDVDQRMALLRERRGTFSSSHLECMRNEILTGESGTHLEMVDSVLGFVNYVDTHSDTRVELRVIHTSNGKDITKDKVSYTTRSILRSRGTDSYVDPGKQARNRHNRRAQDNYELAMRDPDFDPWWTTQDVAIEKGTFAKNTQKFHAEMRTTIQMRGWPVELNDAIAHVTAKRLKICETLILVTDMGFDPASMDATLPTCTFIEVPINTSLEHTNEFALELLKRMKAAPVLIMCTGLQAFVKAETVRGTCNEIDEDLCLETAATIAYYMTIKALTQFKKVYFCALPGLACSDFSASIRHIFHVACILIKSRRESAH